MKASASSARSFASAFSLAIIAMASSIGLAPNPAFGAAPIRIMPVGDSITQGGGAAGGYRLPLYLLLTAAGFNVDFIGTQQDNGAPGLPDPNHEGHPGYRIDQIDSGLLGYFGQNPDPDVILLLIGTNDYGQNYNTPLAINRLEALVAKMATTRPFTKIIVANLLVRGEPYNTQIQQTFNPYLPGMVARQAALGRQVYFTDLRSSVPLSDMPDTLHPDALGYQKMATNWFHAITSLFSPEGSTNAPALAHAYGLVGLTNILLTFSKPVADDAVNITNFSVGGGVNVRRAVLNPVTKRDLTLSTTPQAASSPYSLSVAGVRDRTIRHTPIAANSTIAFLSSGTGARGVFNNVPEAAGYQLVYSLNIPDSPNYSLSVHYNLDLHTNIVSFSRIAYYLELQLRNQPLNFLWVSMDAFTTDVTKIGVPTTASRGRSQRRLTRMNVLSSQPGIVNGTNLAGGNVEFWSINYTAANTAGVPNADDATFDWGDNPTPGNYGSMQVHNHDAGQVLFAFNRWGGAGGVADLGIGTGPNGGSPDWTFAQNASTYLVKTLQVLVNRPPVARCLNVIVPAGTNCLADASVDNGSFNPDGDPLTVRQVPSGPYPLGTNLVTLIVSDTHGASNACMAQVIVQDMTPPALVCPSNLTVEFASPAGTEVFFAPQAADLCSPPVTVTCAPPAGSTFAIGTTDVLCSALDAAGNPASCAFQVTVLGAQGVKSNVLAELIALLNNSPPARTRDALDEAIRHLRTSLTSALWIDQVHLARRDGETVFKEETAATRALQLLQQRKEDALRQVVWQGFIDRMVKADQLLAIVAIREAAEAGVHPNQLNEARHDLAQGDEHVAAERYEEGIDDYGNAWRQASRLVVKLVGHVDMAGHMRLQFSGLPGETYAVETSTNLINWIKVGAATVAPDGLGRFDAVTGDSPRSQFYRARSLP